MREIKFRFWCNRRNMFFCTDYELGVEYYERDFEDGVFQQYTGLKDKNGKEIYEGDLLLSAFCRDEENPVEVSWGDKNNGWNVNHKNGQEGPLLKIHQQSYEVVGNIFEGVDK